jgi:iron complex outermembrane recepter protein
VHDLIKNYTVYGQVGYDITSKLNLTASLRWLQENNNANFVFPVVSAAASTEHALIPSATLSYAIDHGSVYFRWARGFKAGGINPVAAPSTFTNAGVPLSDGGVFGPEKVDTYEAGYKQSLMDRKLQITADVFYNDYTGLQETGHAEPAYASSIILAIVNAGSAQTYGAEASVNYRVVPPVTVGFNVGYLEAKYTNFVIPVTTPQVLAPTNLTGTPLLNSPKWQLSFVANLDQPINDKYRLVGSFVESYLSSQIFDQSLLPGVLPNAAGPAYAITNLRLGVRTMDGKYELAIYANNLFNRAYYTYGASDSFGNDLSWGNPRIVGGQLTVKY